MAVFVNPETLQAIRRPADLADQLKENGFILVPNTEEEKEKPKKAKSKDQPKE